SFYPKSKADCKKINIINLGILFVVLLHAVQLAYLCHLSDGIGTPECSSQLEKRKNQKRKQKNCSLLSRRLEN
ncbi:MAG: hypothetical protein AB8G86_04370, partial [Saprospiraceae bacterium]